MIAFLNAHASQIWSFVVGAISGATISIPITVRVIRVSAAAGANVTNQQGAKAGGDVVGRDKISH